ncbi:MAG: DoxX family protein [Acidobacteria bacterium]|nr:DoxX family protein [Acidobacteriota bacterium]
MKIATLIARILLGLIFTVFGLNGFFHFLPMLLPPGDAGALFTIMFKYGWITFISGLYVIAGVFLLIGRYIGAALTILGPIIVVILLYHFTMDPKGLPLALFVALLEIFLIYSYWHQFDAVVKHR